MKRLLALLLAVCMIGTLVACSSDKKEEQKEPKANEYIMSDNVKEETVIDGVMTDILNEDPILKRTTPSWIETCVLYEVNIRQYTEEGTFAAFEKHLDRLKETGINTLWLMPIHPISKTKRKGTLGSYYSVTDYKDVNPEFGTLDDFKHLMTTAHKKGFKVILDWVANHTGWDNAWITEHKDWYKTNKNGDIVSPYDWTDTAQLNYYNYEMRAEMIKCMQYWVEEMGVDGFRCDHASGVSMSFWNAAVYKLKSINSEILMLAEAGGNTVMTQYAFDACYNDTLYGQSKSVINGVAVSSIQQGMKPSDLYVEGSFPMNYLDNHDKNSYEGTIVENYGKTYEPLLAISFLAPGMPMIYSSNEEGYDHMIEFFEKDTIQWDDKPKYAPLMAALSKVKTGNAALNSTNRDFKVLTKDEDYLFSFSRKKDNNTVIYVANLYDKTLSNAAVDLGVENAKCVLHYDGETLDTKETTMSNSDFAKKSYKPYEFYILTVDAE